LVRLIRAQGTEDEVLASKILAKGEGSVLAVCCDNLTLTFFHGENQYTLKKLIGGIDASLLSTEYAGGFVGTIAGVFASGNGEDVDNSADVEWAE
jgi:alpha-N-arabinofuranosidase